MNNCTQDFMNTLTLSMPKFTGTPHPHALKELERSSEIVLLWFRLLRLSPAVHQSIPPPPRNPSSFSGYRWKPLNQSSSSSYRTAAQKWRVKDDGDHTQAADEPLTGSGYASDKKRNVTYMCIQYKQLEALKEIDIKCEI